MQLQAAPTRDILVSAALVGAMLVIPAPAPSGPPLPPHARELGMLLRTLGAAGPLLAAAVAPRTYSAVRRGVVLASDVLLLAGGGPWLLAPAAAALFGGAHPALLGVCCAAALATAHRLPLPAAAPLLLWQTAPVLFATALGASR